MNLEIKKLTTKLDAGDEITIIDDISHIFETGKSYLLLGPNGAGKSTLAKSIINWPQFSYEGEVYLDEKIITGEEMSERAKLGLFLAHQSPIDIPGVHYAEFVREAANKVRPEDEKYDPWQFKEIFEAQAEFLELPSNITERSLNAGFSGGERKKAEILQMLMIKPKFAFLDEIDSGLDIDSLDLIFEAVNAYQDKYSAGMIVISHNPNILDYYKPDEVILMQDGRIKEIGDKELAVKVFEEGFKDANA